MVLTHPLYCPVRCIEGCSYHAAVAALLDDRSYAIVTSKGWKRRGVVDWLIERCGEPTAVVDQVEPNPRLGKIVEWAPSVARAEVVVALGGGSVIDTAKGFVALNALNGDSARLTAHLRGESHLPDDLPAVAIIAVPTTSGSGSEVTRWGTIWGEDGSKYSVAAPALYPTHAVLDADLCLSMPRDVTLATGLDALSHAMEAVWNRRHTDVTDMLAEQAIRIIRETLPLVLSNLDDRALRQRMQSAALLAGLAMGTTQTAIAHSISYPITAKFAVPHGIACSFSLAEVARYNTESEPDRLRPIANAFESSVEKLADNVDSFLIEVGLDRELARYVSPTIFNQLGDDLITPARAANNIREIDGVEAKALATRALTRLFAGMAA